MKQVKMRVTDKVSAQDVKKHLNSLGYFCKGYDCFNGDGGNYLHYYGEEHGDITYDSSRDDEFFLEGVGYEEIFITPEENVKVADKAVVSGEITSDGGSSSYYTFTITNKAGQTIVVEVQDVIRCMVGDNNSLGNVVKACRRMWEASQGRGKAGVSLEYDANKNAHFSKEFAHWYKDGV